MALRARTLVLAPLLLVAGLTGAGFLKVWAEGWVRSWLESRGARYGLSTHVDDVRVGLFPPVLLNGLAMERRGRLSFRTASVSVRFALGRGGTPALQLGLGPGRGSLPGGLGLDLSPTVWEVIPGLHGSSASLREPVEGLLVSWSSNPRRTEVRLDHLAVISVFRILVNDIPSVDPGTVDGEITLGEPKPGAIAGDWHLAAAGVVMGGTVVLAGPSEDPRLGLDLRVEKVDLARLLASSGLGLAVGAEDLGTAALVARFTGRLSDPGSFTVTHHLDFVPPRTPIPAVERLKADFVHEVELPDGTRHEIEVSSSGPDFVPLAEVPPLFVRTLLLAEDAGFFGHQGLDLSELAVAAATNWARGSAARGGSTISQQLAKNLFLTREKTLGRKLQELALTLLLESSLGKNRILEIYLNIIEWGPGLYGLKPAARHYFDKEPRELSPKEMAFLVALIPGPIKYQSSFAGGELSARFEPLVNNLLAKLRSVEALSEEDYEAARNEKLVFRQPAPPPEP
jgi:hypothetical protein